MMTPVEELHPFRDVDHVAWHYGMAFDNAHVTTRAAVMKMAIDKASAP